MVSKGAGVGKGSMSNAATRAATDVLHLWGCGGFQKRADAARGVILAGF